MWTRTCPCCGRDMHRDRPDVDTPCHPDCGWVWRGVFVPTVNPEPIPLNLDYQT